MAIKFLNTLQVDTDVLYVDAATDNVGIGTASPQSNRKLDVVGHIQGSQNLYLGVAGTNSSTNTIEIGQGRTGNGFAYMDLTGDATYSDYGLRIIRNNTGANTSSQIIHRGTGEFSITTTESADILLIPNSGNVGIGTTAPKAKLDVNGHFCVDSKVHTVTNTFTTCLTINLASHTGCYVVLTCFGDWPDHSTAAYRGEFFVQASGTGTAYNEPGAILRQDDNTTNLITSNVPDQILCQIVDPPGTGNPKDFQIQIRHTDSIAGGSFTGQLTYTVQGKFNSIT